MNASSGNHTQFSWYVCIDQGYAVQMLYGASQVLCFLLGIPALVWCLWISLSGSLSGGDKPTQIFPINMFAVELVFCGEGLLEVISYLFIRNALMLRQAVYVLYYLVWICRPLLQSCICVELYLAVSQPVAFLKYRLRRYRVACSTMVWVLSLTYACFDIALMGYEETKCFALISVYCFGVAVIFLCCYFILRVMKQPGPGEVEGAEGERRNAAKVPHKMRVFVIVLTYMVIILEHSIPVVVGWDTLSSSLEITCNIFPMLMIINKWGSIIDLKYSFATSVVKTFV